MDNMCIREWKKRIDPSSSAIGGTALSSPCDLLCTVCLYIQYMEDRHLQCDMCGRLRGGEKPNVHVLYMMSCICAPVMGVSVCSSSGCVYVFM